MTRRSTHTTLRPGAIDETDRLLVADHAPTRVFRPAPRPPAVVIVEPDARRGPLPHPRLVRRTRTETAAPEPPARQMTARDREFEDAPTMRSM